MNKNLKQSVAFAAIMATMGTGFTAHANENVESTKTTKNVTKKVETTNVSAETDYINKLVSSGKLSDSEKAFFNISKNATSFKMTRFAANASQLKKNNIFATNIYMDFYLGELEAWDESEKEYFKVKNSENAKGYPTLDIIHDLLVSNKSEVTGKPRTTFNILKSSYTKEHKVDYSYQIQLDDNDSNTLWLKLYKYVNKDKSYECYKYDVLSKKMVKTTSDELDKAVTKSSLQGLDYITDTIHYSKSSDGNYHKYIIGLSSSMIATNFQDGVVVRKVNHRKEVDTTNIRELNGEASKMMNNILKETPEESINVFVSGSNGISLTMTAQKESANVYSINTVISSSKEDSTIQGYPYRFYDFRTSQVVTRNVDVNCGESLEIDHRKVKVDGNKITDLCTIYHTDDSIDIEKISDRSLYSIVKPRYNSTHVVANLSTNDLTKLVDKSKEIVDTFTTNMPNGSIFIDVVGAGVEVKTTIKEFTDSTSEHNYEVMSRARVTGNDTIKYAREILNTKTGKMKLKTQKLKPGDRIDLSGKVIYSYKGEVKEQCLVLYSKDEGVYYAKQIPDTIKYDYVSKYDLSSIKSELEKNDFDIQKVNTNISKAAKR